MRRQRGVDKLRRSKIVEPRQPGGDDFEEEVRSASFRQPLPWRALDRKPPQQTSERPV